MIQLASDTYSENRLQVKKQQAYQAEHAYRIKINSAGDKKYTELRMYSKPGSFIEIVPLKNEQAVDISFLEYGLCIVDIRDNKSTYRSKLLIKYYNKPY